MYQQNTKNYRVALVVSIILLISILLLIYEGFATYFIHQMYAQLSIDLSSKSSIYYMGIVKNYFPTYLNALLFIENNHPSQILQDILTHQAIFILLVTLVPAILIIDRSQTLKWFSIKCSKKNLLKVIFCYYAIFSVITCFLPTPPPITEQLNTTYADFITWFRPLVLSPIYEEFVFRILLIGASLIIVSKLNNNNIYGKLFIAFIAIIATALDTSLHLQYGVANFIFVFVNFLFTGYIFIKSRNILVPIFFHCFINFSALVFSIFHAWGWV